MLVIDDIVKSDLKPLEQLPADTIRDFCKAVRDMIVKGSVNSRLYTSASQKLGWDAETARRAFEALGALLLEAAKGNLAGEEFERSIPLAFEQMDAEARKALAEFYSENVSQLRAALGEVSMSVPEYADLEFRAECGIARRGARESFEPSATLRLRVCEPQSQSQSQSQLVNSSLQTHLFESDPATLRHIIEQLEEAQRTMKLSYVKRVLRYVK